MKKRRNVAAIVAAVVVAAAALAACQKNNADNVVARFKGGSLTIEDLDAHRQLLGRQASFRDKPEQLTPEFVFDHAVNMEMIIAKGLKEKLHLDPRVRVQIHGFMSDLFLKVLQEKLVPQIDKAQFTEEQVRAYFDEHIDSYRNPALYEVRLIRHADFGFLEELRRNIESGEQRFEDAAVAHSTDAASKANGGSIGRRSLARFRPQWRAVIAPLAVGAIAGPVQIKDSYYLFQTVAGTPPQEPDDEEKKAYVRNDLLYFHYRQAWQQAYDRLKKEFDLKVNDHALEHFTSGKDRHEHDAG